MRRFRSCLLTPSSGTPYRRALDGCIGIFNCRFIECEFDGIGWAGTETFLQKMREAVMFGRWEEELGE